jgi:uncharacterized protein YdiU (UPF0061 family)
MKIDLKNIFTANLPADSNDTNQVRQVYSACFSYVNPTPTSNPKLIHYTKEVAELIGITDDDVKSNEFLEAFSGNKVLENSKPFAMCYGGHQFGHWAGQLGDGRAINLFEIEKENSIYTLQLKGAGKTPYSRTADGLAVLRSSIREHLCSEAMHHLGVPTTRSLSLCLSGNQVLRDVLYDGNAAYEKGAIVCRVAPSFIRFGNFEIFSARNDIQNLKLLTDFTIKHYYKEVESEDKEKYIHFFELVANKTLEMIIHWQRVGFVHGVMNTDNMSIHGITIDYGPYGWLEDYNPNWTPNTTDREHKRYRFGNQSEIALWNLYQLANSLYPLVNEAAPFEKVLSNFKDNFEERYYTMMSNKLGLFKTNRKDKKLIIELEQLLQVTETDMTIFFRELSYIKKEYSTGCGISIVNNSFYKPNELTKSVLKEWEKWFKKYMLRLNEETISDEEKKSKMNQLNPKYVLRNYMAQLAIEGAEIEDYSVLNELVELLKKPYEEQPEFEKWYAKRPDWAREKVGCSMLSCSS